MLQQKFTGADFDPDDIFKSVHRFNLAQCYKSITSVNDDGVDGETGMLVSLGIQAASRGRVPCQNVEALHDREKDR